MSGKSPTIQRLLAGLCLAGAFIVMASIFAPDRTRAGSAPPSPVPLHPDITSPSTNPHEGLQSMGTVEDDLYTVSIYATDVGPRYSVYENATGKLVGTLLTIEKLDQQFPELQIPTMEFEASEAIMLAEPRQSSWPQ